MRWISTLAVALLVVGRSELSAQIAVVPSGSGCAAVPVLLASVGAVLFVLPVFGYVEGRFTTAEPFRNGR